MYVNVYWKLEDTVCQISKCEMHLLVIHHIKFKYKNKYSPSSITCPLGGLLEAQYRPSVGYHWGMGSGFNVKNMVKNSARSKPQKLKDSY